MTFLKKLIKEINPEYLGNDDEVIINSIITNLNIWGQFLNKIPIYEDDVIESLGESIYQYYLKLRDYHDYKNGEKNMLFPKRDNNVTPGKTRLNQNINTLKKARDLLQYVSSKDYRIMQGHHGIVLNQNGDFIPTPPMGWQTKKNGKQKYKNIESYCFTNCEDKEVALKAYNQTIALYNKKYGHESKYQVEKDIFNTYWFITSLIQDLENQVFYLFEKTEYYPPEKPSKTQMKTILKFIGKEFDLKSSLHEKQLIDNIDNLDNL